MISNKYISGILGALVVILAFALYHYYQAYVSVSNFSINPQNSGDNIFQVASSTGEVYLTVRADGKVGVNTAVPQTALDIRGMARVYTSDITPCTKEIEGAIAYDPYTEHFIGCNSFEWRRLDN